MGVPAQKKKKKKEKIEKPKRPIANIRKWYNTWCFSELVNSLRYDWLSLYLFQSPRDPRELQIQPNAYWWFTIVDTTGRREMSRWNVGQHVSRGHNEDRIGHKWFTNE